ncbi:MAG: electron transfer flavoprotein subunit beta/FixA family protein, partial [Polyangiales bacterium]
IINPYDLFSLEEALRLRDAHGGEVTVVSMGPPMAADALRKALTYGADRAVLLTDRYFAGSDTLATSFALASALTRIGELYGTPDVVFTGKQTIDGDTAQVGPGIAKRLGYQQLTYVNKILELDPKAGTCVVERRAEGGVQILQSKLPVLVTMLEADPLRRGSMEEALRAARSEIIRWSAAQAGITELTRCGLKGSPTVVKKVYAPSARAERAKPVGSEGASPAQLAGEILEAMFTQAPALEADLLALSAERRKAG